MTYLTNSPYYIFVNSEASEGRGSGVQGRAREPTPGAANRQGRERSDSVVWGHWDPTDDDAERRGAQG